jgi:hypothetical protein
MVILILGCTILHATIRPLHSPFTSTLTDLIIEVYLRSLYALNRGAAALYSQFPRSALSPHIFNIYPTIRDHIWHLRAYRNVSGIHIHHITAYHTIMSQTYDDNLLDDGSSALKAILQVTPGKGDKASTQSMMDLVAYLFTPAASRRSAMTAARAIEDYKPSTPGKQI